LRLETLHVPVGDEKLMYVLPIIIAIPIFIRLGLYRAIFRYVGQHAMFTILKAITIYGALIFSLLLFWDILGFPKTEGVLPRSLGILHPLILLVLIVLSRFLARLWLVKSSLSKRGNKGARRILIYGAGVSGIQLGASLKYSGQYYLVGYLDDDLQLRHKNVNGLTVYGVDEIDQLITKYAVTDILLALPTIQQSRRNEILNYLRRFHIHVRSLPSITDLADGKINVSDIRELDVADLLGRNSVAPNKELFEKNIKNQVVMVTGAGGSIGGELTRQIVSYQPKTLILLEQSEFALYVIYEELKSRVKNANLNIELVPLLGNVRQYDWLKSICTAWQINTIYHSAAYKHVPIVEHNVTEGILNNVFGTLNTALIAIETGVDQFVLISTDKAVRPTNVMGASKRLAEMVLQALAHQEYVKTIFSMVRFGNVLDSSGSVVPLFQSQIRAGGPLTLTHPDVTRYFMTISEAAQLVIQAGAMSTNSKLIPQGCVFVLDMGEPVKIIDLAKTMIELSGFSVQDQKNPDGDILIEVIGLRPGEKLYEELLIGDNPMPTDHPKIMRAQETFMSWSDLENELTILKESLNQCDVQAIHQQLKKLVSGYNSDSGIVDYVFGANNLT
jgi:FlaA1/EpsC-like NDP-sugar epimerase